MMPLSPAYRPDPAHVSLGGELYDPVRPAVFPKTILRHRNQRWAERLGLGTLDNQEWVDTFGHFQPLPGNLEQPLALRYHGHQFRHYNPDLGDGRGFLFAQLRDPVDGRLLDLGTKGSGQTPWSRQGDGRLTLKGGVREVLATAMLEALGVPTSKSFSLVETGEALWRNDEPSPTRSAVLVRLSHSHIRIGTFQRLAFHSDSATIRRLLTHTITHYYPDLRDLPADEQPAAFVGAVAQACARTTAAWMAAGFVHGVLNTDNINITGESFDYGPYRFLPHYDARFTAAYFDQSGLYCYGRQPASLQWNLARLAGCFLDLVPAEPLNAALERFSPAFEAALRAAVLHRLNLAPTNNLDADLDHIATLFQAMADSKAPFQRVFFDWCGGDASRAAASPQAALYASAAFQPAAAALAAFSVADEARQHHAYLQRRAPVDLLYDEIETIWAAIAQTDDWTLLAEKLRAIDDLRLFTLGPRSA